MQITINKKAYTLKFGLKFIRELDEKYYFEREGVKYGTALENKVPFILSKDPVTLAEFIYAATCTEDNRPTQDEIDTYIECSDIEKLFAEVAEELKKSNVTKNKMEHIEALLILQEAASKDLKKDQKKPTKN